MGINKKRSVYYWYKFYYYDMENYSNSYIFYSFFFFNIVDRYKYMWNLDCYKCCYFCMVNYCNSWICYMFYFFNFVDRNICNYFVCFYNIFCLYKDCCGSNYKFYIGFWINFWSMYRKRKNFYFYMFCYFYIYF